MPLYHVHIQLNNERAVIAVDHVLEEYGICEQEFVSTWFVDRPEIQGDGETFEEAIIKLFEDLAKYEERHIIYKNEMHLLEMRHQYCKSTKQSKTKFRTPIIGNANG